MKNKGDASKKYGGCEKCSGSGYNLNVKTHNHVLTVTLEGSTEKSKSEQYIHLTFCGCVRGELLEKFIRHRLFPIQDKK